MSEQAETATTRIDPERAKQLAEEREEVLQHLLKVFEEAYRQKKISVQADHEGVVYTVRIPHDRTGAGFELFVTAVPPI